MCYLPVILASFLPMMMFGTPARGNSTDCFSPVLRAHSGPGILFPLKIKTHFKIRENTMQNHSWAKT